MAANMSEPRPSSPGRARILTLIGVVILVLIAFQYRHLLTLQTLAKYESSFRLYEQQHPVLVSLGIFLVYALVTGLSIPGAVPLSLFSAWLLGFWKALIVVSFGSTTGATIAFLLSRFLFKNTIEQRFGPRLIAFNEALKFEGPFYLFTLRLIPAVPFFVINAVMGLTPIRTRTFWWVSQLGMLPGTALYVYAGSQVPQLQTLAEQGILATFTARQVTQLLIAFSLPGLLSLGIRRVFRRRRNAPQPEPPVEPAELRN